MAQSKMIAPPNSLLCIADRPPGEVPTIDRDRRIWFTSSCIMVPCLMFADGETKVTLGSASEIDPGGKPAFDGMLDTPEHNVIVSTVEHETIVETKVGGTQTRIRIWINHPTEPDDVVISVG